jgi:hypothetical protein
MSEQGERLFRFVAQQVSHTEGSHSLNRFAKLMVIGQLKEKGFEDIRNSNTEEVFDSEWIFAGYFNLLVRFSFLSSAKKFVWDFGSGNVVGKSVGETFISSKGRHSKWVGDGAEKRWEENNISGVVLVGMGEDDSFQFLYITKEEFLKIGKDKLICKPDSVKEWEDNWKNLVIQKSFFSELGAGQ